MNRKLIIFVFCFALMLASSAHAFYYGKSSVSECQAITNANSGDQCFVVDSSGVFSIYRYDGATWSECSFTAAGGTSTEWNSAYDNRITSATAPISIVSNSISISQATTSTNGYLSSTDWNTFNNKVSAETDPIVGAINGLVKADGAGTIAAAVEDTDYQGVLAEGAFVDGDKTKLDGIESGADVTDAANVNAVESDPIVGAISGIPIADGAGNISRAVPGIDYVNMQNVRSIGEWSGNLSTAVTALDVAGNAGESFTILIDQAATMSADIDLSSLSHASAISIVFLDRPDAVLTLDNDDDLTIATGPAEYDFSHFSISGTASVTFNYSVTARVGSYAGLAAAITAAPDTILVTAPITLTGDVEVPSGTRLTCTPNSPITPNGHTLTYASGSYGPGPDVTWQCFSGAGVTFDYGCNISTAYIEWWWSGSGDCGAAFQYAADAFTLAGTIQLLNKTYPVATQVEITKYINITGSGCTLRQTTVYGTIIQSTVDTPLYYNESSSPVLPQKLVLKDFAVNQTVAGYSIVLNNVVMSIAERLVLYGNRVGDGIQYQNASYIAKMSDSIIMSCATRAISVAANCTGTMYDFYNNNLGLKATGLESEQVVLEILGSVGDCRMRDNQFGGDPTYTTCIYVLNSQGENISGPSISGNHFENYLYGIKISGGATYCVDDSYIVDNTWASPSTNGIAIKLMTKARRTYIGQQRRWVTGGGTSYWVQIDSGALYNFLEFSELSAYWATKVSDSGTATRWRDPLAPTNQTIALTFTTVDITASALPYMQLNGLSTQLIWVAPCAGELTAISGIADAALTAGAINIRVYKNGASWTTTNLEVVLDDTNQKNYMTKKYNDPILSFAAGDEIKLRAIANADLAPSGSLDLLATLVVRLQN